MGFGIALSGGITINTSSPTQLLLKNIAASLPAPIDPK